MMKRASITETRNRLSAILEQVREGETFLILDRGKPVARIEPVREGRTRSEEETILDDLERRGILKRGRGRIRKELIETPPPKMPKGLDILETLLEERRGGW